MRRGASLLLLVLLVVPWFGCGNGQECDRCSQDSDCTSGFVCTKFSDGSSRCGTGLGATTCRVR
jgi:Cys-rich repeat protein